MKAPRNRTIDLSDSERKRFTRKLKKVDSAIQTFSTIKNKVINADFFDIAKFLPEKYIDLLFVDPPYNLTKQFNSTSFTRQKISDYTDWVESWLVLILPMLKETSSIYICGDWRCSSAIHQLCEKYFNVQNRITFEREKGRGSKKNWKNNSEDIWFCTKSRKFHFDSEAVKLKRRVVAPYREDKAPKDWQETDKGNFRLTYPSNIWTDISIPFWSMPENTPHPTQKPEKLLAKIILASSKPGDVVFDPFAGVGTTGVVAQKLDRKFTLVEIDKEYCLFSLKRLELAKENKTIQGYSDSVFWERNTHSEQKSSKPEEL